MRFVSLFNKAYCSLLQLHFRRMISYPFYFYFIQPVHYSREHPPVALWVLFELQYVTQPSAFAGKVWELMHFLNRIPAQCIYLSISSLFHPSVILWSVAQIISQLLPMLNISADIALLGDPFHYILSGFFPLLKKTHHAMFVATQHHAIRHYVFSITHLGKTRKGFIPEDLMLRT